MEGISGPIIFSEIQRAIRWQGNSGQIIKRITDYSTLLLGKIFDRSLQLLNLVASLWVHVWLNRSFGVVDYLGSQILGRWTGLQRLNGLG